MAGQSQAVGNCMMQLPGTANETNRIYMCRGWFLTHTFRHVTT